MYRVRLVALVTLAAFLVGALPVAAEPAGRDLRPGTTETSALQASIDRAGREAAAQIPVLPARRAPVRKQMSGGGGGNGKMIMSLVMTGIGLASTYFVIKEMKKQTDELKQTMPQ